MADFNFKDWSSRIGSLQAEKMLIGMTHYERGGNSIGLFFNDDDE
jgi:hypothetical protein